MWTKWLGIWIALVLTVTVAACRADERSEDEIAKLRARVKELETENKNLRVEVARLKDEVYWVPGPKAKDGQKLPKKEKLKDGMSLSAAMKLLGPPTRISDDHVEWYSNPRGLHVAPFVCAKMTKEGLKEWKFGNR
jgi:regulator of replication initiation timing